MEDPGTYFGKFGNHAEIRYTDVRVPAANLVGNEGAGFQLARPASARAASTTACAGSASRGGPSTCCVTGRVALRPRLDAGGEADRAELGGGLARRDACGEAHDAAAAWKMDQVGAAEARVEIAMIKYYGASVLYNVIDRAIQVTARSGTRATCPGADVPRRARRSDL